MTSGISIDRVQKSRDFLKRLYKALHARFLEQGRILKSIEVWSNVLYLRFTSGRNTFFSKTTAFELVGVDVKFIPQLGVGLRHVNLDAKASRSNKAATAALNSAPPEIAEMMKRVVARQAGVEVEDLVLSVARN